MKFDICLTQIPSQADPKQICNLLTAGLIEFLQHFPQACHKMNLIYVLYYWCRDSFPSGKHIRELDWNTITERAIQKSKLEPFGDPKFDVERALYCTEEAE